MSKRRTPEQQLADSKANLAKARRRLAEAKDANLAADIRNVRRVQTALRARAVDDATAKAVLEIDAVLDQFVDAWVDDIVPPEGP